MADGLLTPRPVLTVGRKRTTHLARVLIEGDPARVVVRTRCGLSSPVDEGFGETFGFPSCDECREGDA